LKWPGEVPAVTSRRREDPRPALSRARLLDAATSLLSTGGPSAVTVDAVTRAANVARATLYRHFPSGNDLLAAAFVALIPPAPMPPEEGSLRDRLTALVEAQAESMAEAPALLSAMSWLAMGSGIEHWPAGPAARDSAEVATLRERIAEQYSAPFDALFDSPEAKAEFGNVDRAQAIALLLGPILLGKLSTLVEFDYGQCVHAAVDGFLASHGAASAELRSTRGESTGS
jgi:AcrR family transcriptional regulator